MKNKNYDTFVKVDPITEIWIKDNVTHHSRLGVGANIRDLVEYSESKESGVYLSLERGTEVHKKFLSIPGWYVVHNVKIE